MRQNQRNGGFRRSRMRFPAGGSHNCKLDCGFNHAESRSESLAVIIPFLIHFYAWRILQIKNKLTPSASKISFFIESIESVSKPNDWLSPTYVFLSHVLIWRNVLYKPLQKGCHPGLGFNSSWESLAAKLSFGDGFSRPLGWWFYG